MRLAEPFVYRMIDLRPRVPVVFDFIRERGPVDLREMYATFNMGVGFAADVDAKDAAATVEIAKKSGYTVWIGGSVIKDGNRKVVEIKPLGITFEGDTLQVR